LKGGFVEKDIGHTDFANEGGDEEGEEDHGLREEEKQEENHLSKQKRWKKRKGWSFSRKRKGKKGKRREGIRKGDLTEKSLLVKIWKLKARPKRQVMREEQMTMKVLMKYQEAQ
jgi:hypothetical protein